jgi:hypothetical protein
MKLKFMAVIGVIAACVVVTIKYLHEDPKDALIKLEGERVLSNWDKFFSFVTANISKKIKGDMELFGYFFAVSKDDLKPEQYHFEERQWAISLNENFSQFFTEASLNRDFKKLWCFLNVIHNKGVSNKNIQIEVWEYENEPFVSVAFAKSGETWKIWVKGMEVAPKQ